VKGSSDLTLLEISRAREAKIAGSNAHIIVFSSVIHEYNDVLRRRVRIWRCFAVVKRDTAGVFWRGLV